MAKLSLGVNPLMVKELRGYMRDTWAYAVLTMYIAIVSGIALLLYLGVSLANPASGVGNSSQVGSALFYVVVGLQIVLVSFVAPAFTLRAISSERERHTFDLLKSTLLSPRQIVWGKLIPVLGYVLLLVLATTPLFSLAFLLGGVEAGQLAAALCVILSSAALFTTLGLFVSSCAPSTLGATIVTYSIVVG
ncbi:MAG: ABC transporter permease, partial [Candidatus Roseilinea sp.]|uniref:ABC transporter permease n=1 Tax=Candidatus Roseilinea sp. TaxID=2838777 RepID=UPI004049B4F1